MSVAPTLSEVTLRLSVPKTAALRHLKARIQQGLSIRRRSVRYMEDLEEARAAKAEWVHACTEMLRAMFQGEGGAAAADRCNDWVGRVYPDYAEMELFVGQFYEEMDHRLARLRALAQEVIEMSDPIAMPRPTITPESPGGGKVELLAGGNADAVREPAPSGAPVTSEPEIEEPQPAPGGLLVVHEAAATSAEPVRTFLHALGIAVRMIPSTAQDSRAANLALEQHRDAASFAVVLLGQGECSAGTPAVAFQLGYLAGRLGMPRVCVMSGGDAGSSANPFGVPCLALDAANGWQLQLARHLKRAGVEVDLNKLC